MKNMKLKQKKGGYVLISVLIIMMILLTMMYFFSDALFSELAIANNQKSATVSFHLAEAGAQEAVWRIQNDSTTRNTFLNTASGLTTFSHNNFMTNGSYTVNIQNISKGAATISVTGLYQSGIKQAQRRILVNVYQAITGAYSYDAGLFVGGPGSGDIYLHNLTVNFGSDYDKGGISGGGNIDIGNATLNLTKDLLANGTITTKNSNINLPPDIPPVPPDTEGVPGGIQQSDYPTNFDLPGIDIESFKTLAQVQNQYYTSAQFATLLKTKNTFTGVVYVSGSGGIDLKKDHLVINGLLVSEGSISIDNDTLTIKHNPAPSGLITLANFNVNNATVNIEGLVYVSNLAASANNANITVTGAILAHDFSANNIDLTINLKKDWVNETFAAGGNSGSAVIKTQHWEEEY